MKIEELAIGSILAPGVVSSLDESENFVGFRNGGILSIYDVQPVAIKHDFLVDAGFRKIENGESFLFELVPDELFVHAMRKPHGNYRTFLENHLGDHLFEIGMFVHQLQNMLRVYGTKA